MDESLQQIKSRLEKELAEHSTMTPQPLEAVKTISQEEIKAQKEREFCQAAGIDNLRCTFESFDQSCLKTDDSKMAFAAFKEIAKVPPAKPFLLCLGTTGTGKSHLIQATIIEWGKQGKLARYMTAPGLVGLLKSQIASDNLETMMMRVCTMFALIVDDLGTEYGTPFEKSLLDRIIDARYRTEKITVVASNFRYPVLQAEYPRLTSRMSDLRISRVVWNANSDYRMRTGKEK